MSPEAFVGLKKTGSALPVVLLALAAGTGTAIFNACTQNEAQSRAYRITQRSELIGGPRALGEIGDFMLENDQIRVVIQDQGFSRGFGVFGGSLIDADLVRPSARSGDSSGGEGKDLFGEMFPAFFLEALEPSDVINPLDPTNPAPENRLKAIEVSSDGKNGDYAEVVVRGYGGDFLALTQQINQILLSDDRQNPQLLFTTRYRLRPGVRYLEIETTVQNVSIPSVTITLPNEFAGAEVPTPFGDVVLFGAGNKVFMPHEAGYDMRYRLEAQYADNPYTLPALPGLVGEFIATTGPGVSYGLFTPEQSDPERNYAWQNRDQYTDATPHSLHVPFIASAFTGVFQVMPPPVIAANDRQPGGPDEFTFRRYFIIGDGDVASISDEVYALLEDETGTVSGRLLEKDTLVPVRDAHVLVLNDSGKKITEMTTHAEGRFEANLRPGDYVARIVKSGRATSDEIPFSIEKDSTSFVDWRIDGAAQLHVTVTEPGVGRVPAKVTLVGTGPESFAGQDTKTWLFDLSVGEEWRFSDLVPDTGDPATRQYIEAFEYTRRGNAKIEARPGTYRYVVSRGLEYDRVEGEVVLEVGKTKSIEVELHRVIDTTGYVGADFHLHSSYSLDSFHSPADRLRSFAGEGLELVVSTDHNFVSDYQPVIGELGLEQFLSSAIGLELTTIDRGHFNGFPLRMGSGSLLRDGAGELKNTIASRTYGSFEWAGRTPQAVFDALRLSGLEKQNATCLAQNPGTPEACADEFEPVIVQVNHPRDSILGYFEQYLLNQETLDVEGQGGLLAPVVSSHPEFAPENFSWDFDAIEIFNGKRFELLRNYRVPEEGVPEVDGYGLVDPVSCCPLQAGGLYREKPAFDCDAEERDCACLPQDVEAQLAAGKCTEDGAILYPGAVDDWFQILRAGKKVIGTANSDSHDPHKEEPGYPRTYISSAVDEPSLLRPRDIQGAFQSGNILMTNGPFVQVTAKGNDGQTVGMGQMAQGSQIELEVKIQAAPWIPVKRLVVYVNGEAHRTDDIAGIPLPHRVKMAIDVAVDSFIVVEVSGEGSLFPTVAPNEIPPLQFSDVVGAIGGSFGLGDDGGLRPEQVFPTHAYALTNPIWVDADRNGSIQPSLAVEELLAQTRQGRERVQAGMAQAAPPPSLNAAERGSTSRNSWTPRTRTARKLSKLRRSLPEWLWPSDHPKDIRRVWVQFLQHAH